MYTLVKYNEINFDNILYLPPQKIDDDNWFIRFKYINIDKSFLIQTPYLYIPLGIGKNFMNDLSFLDLSVFNCKELNEILDKFDEKIQKDSIKFSNNWFFYENNINVKYEKIIKNDYINEDQENNVLNDNNFNYIRVFLPKDNENNWSFNMYDYDKQLIDIDHNLSSDIYARCILLCDGLWFTKENYGVSLKLVQIQKQNISENNSEFLFKD